MLRDTETSSVPARSPKLQRAPIGRMVALSLGTAGVFGVNSIFFFISQNHLGNIASSIENLQALDHTISNERNEIIPALRQGQKLCLNSFPDGCQPYVEALLFLRNRASDYSAALEADFQATENSPIIKELIALSDAINQVAAQGYGLSFASAKSLGIFSPEAYIGFVKGNAGKPNAAAFETQSTAIVIKAVKVFNRLSDYSSAYAKTVPSFQATQTLTTTLYWIIVLAEILVFSLVGSIALLNTRAEALSKKTALRADSQ